MSEATHRNNSRHICRHIQPIGRHKSGRRCHSGSPFAWSRRSIVIGLVDMLKSLSFLGVDGDLASSSPTRPRYCPRLACSRTFLRLQCWQSLYQERLQSADVGCRIFQSTALRPPSGDTRHGVLLVHHTSSDSQAWRPRSHIGREPRPAEPGPAGSPPSAYDTREPDR